MQINDILNEEVFSSLAVGYHRTRNLKNTTAIGESGFKAGSRSMYGTGIYLTYDFDDQQDDRMKELYGPYVVRCKVNLRDFLIFDPDVALRVYGDGNIRRQLDYFGIEYADPNQPSQRRSAAEWEKVVGGNILQPSEYSSDPARHFSSWFFRKQPSLKRGLKGLVFTGRQDGRVIVAYDRSAVIPFAWARVVDNTKTRETVRWHKIDAPPMTQAAEAMPEHERAYRYLREQGFTLLSHGSNGATLMGVRDGDYLSIIVTDQSTDQTMVKAFCNRVDPAKTKVPGYAERLGIWLIYQEFTGKLPLAKIMDTILTTHEAMKTRPAQHIAFTESLLRHIMKPGVAIQQRNQPGTDYRGDKIFMTAGSINVVLDSPYREFTTGKVRIATTPIPTELAFNDGSPRGGGPASIAGAYKVLLQTVMSQRSYRGLTWPDDLQPQFITDLTAELQH